MHPKPRIRIYPALGPVVPGHIRKLRVDRVRTILATRPLDRPSHLERVHRLQRVERLLTDRPGPGGH